MPIRMLRPVAPRPPREPISDETREHLHEIWGVVCGGVLAVVLLIVMCFLFASCTVNNDRTQSKKDQQEISSCVSSGGQWIDRNCIKLPVAGK